jgi:hypothetical protein
MPKPNVKYSHDFYSDMKKASADSYSFLATWIFNYCSPKSAIDWGAGTGELLMALQISHNVRVRALEGHWIKELPTSLPKIYYEFRDLRFPFKLEEKFDVAICLEVAEHLEDEYAQTLIDGICNSSDLIFFSAAIPYQGGTSHVNEQWPIYWAEKFHQAGFVLAHDPREELWDNPEVAAYYKQNLLIFERSEGNLKLVVPRPLIHPSLWERKCITHSLKKKYVLARLIFKIMRWGRGRN